MKNLAPYVVVLSNGDYFGNALPRGISPGPCFTRTTSADCAGHFTSEQEAENTARCCQVGWYDVLLHTPQGCVPVPSAAV